MKTSRLWLIPYGLWVGLFVLVPTILMLFQSFVASNGQITLSHYHHFLRADGAIYLRMTLNSFIYAALITLITLFIAYPFAYILTKLTHKNLWLMLIILPTWINLLLKAYAFMGLLGAKGAINEALLFLGLGTHQLLFTKSAFVLVAVYIQLPFMIIPIFQSLKAIDDHLIAVSRDLGASQRQTFWKVIFPLSLKGVRSGVQAVFIPSLSLFMLTRLIGGNRVITLGTAIEQQFLTTQNWGMGATIGEILMLVMVGMMWMTRERRSM